MTENEFLLADRIAKIKSVICKYGEENFYISFSGGKDSTVLSKLIDLAIPGNTIPRVYANTGIELNMIRDFVFDMAKADDRVVVIKPSVPIKQMLESDGYPFKSKQHALWVERYKRIGRCDGVRQYLGEREDKKAWRSQDSCPKCLKYQFTDEFNAFKISDKCCVNLKEKPLKKWSKENNRPYGINGIMRSEGGRREKGTCMLFSGTKLKLFQPLIPISKEWEEWFIEQYHVEICAVYLPPYNLKRTGCKGCPFALHLQEELDMLESLFPAERKQCEIIWKPVYEEYRRIGYRLKNKPDYKKNHQLTIEEYINHA